VLSDERGSVRLVIKVADGTVAQQLDYDEFGRVLTDTNPGFQPFGFAGGLYDPDTGLVRFGLRDFDPVVGQWLTRDPLLFRGGSLSLYAYVNNDPINWIDPLGTGPWAGRMWDNGKNLLGMTANAATTVGGLVLLGAEETGFLAYQVVNAGFGVVGGAINQAALNHGAKVAEPFPDSIPALLAFVGYGGHPTEDAKNGAAVLDLSTSLAGLRLQAAKRLGNTADMFGRAGKAAGRLDSANNAVSALDKGGSPYGLSPSP
jgi:RHS repeat-associated protein